MTAPLFARIVIDLSAYWEDDPIVEFHRSLVSLWNTHLRPEAREGKQVVVCCGEDSTTNARELATAGQHLGLAVASGERALDVIASVLRSSRVPTLLVSSHVAAPQFLSDFPEVWLMSDITEARVCGVAGFWAKTKVLPEKWVRGLAIAGFRTKRSALESGEKPDQDVLDEFTAVDCDVTIKRVVPDLVTHRAWLAERAVACLQPDLWSRVSQIACD